MYFILLLQSPNASSLKINLDQKAFLKVYNAPFEIFTFLVRVCVVVTWLNAIIGLFFDCLWEVTGKCQKQCNIWYSIKNVNRKILTKTFLTNSWYVFTCNWPKRRFKLTTRHCKQNQTIAILPIECQICIFFCLWISS